jgi:hypothetical protein
VDQPVTRRALVIALVFASLVSAAAGAGGGVALSASVVKRGPTGDTGPSGPRGAQGPQGESGEAVDEETIYAAIENDPQRVAEAIQDSLDGSVIQANMDPNPADVESNLEDLCSEIELSDNSSISDLALSGCP